MSAIVTNYEQRRSEADTLAGRIVRNGAQRLVRASERLSVRNAIAAQAELLNSVVASFVALCYEEYEDGSLANVDPADYRILIAMPWGRSTHRAYGLRRSERDALRLYLDALQDGQQRPPAFIYNTKNRRWHLNVMDYRTRADADRWWAWAELKPATWAQATDMIRKRRARR